MSPTGRFGTRRKLAPLITAIGMSFILQNAAALVYGFVEQPLPDILPTKALFTIGGIPYTQKSLLIVAHHDPGRCSC